eukprot:TRINITY_DN1108_c1_g1_i1.p1 TRINITY_DN1108_c1_g1~~TRINITY_DN1108_c1_g1_i1.p1  ORF type:complete len:914 (-),score=246.16 TRINITY_DN1108_c1_g1_i1:36-2777(-)
MRGLKHPNIIRLYETMKTSHLYCMVTELADGGELLSHVRHDYKERRLPEAAARPFVRQLVSALQHLHVQGIVHRDLKMENILLDKKKRYTKIVDFGLSNAAQPGSLLATHCGSPEYAAPELFIPGRQYGPEVDIWSLGVNMFAMMVGKLPFRSPKQGNRKRQRLLEMISNGLSEAHEKEMQHLTPACIDMIKMLLQPDIDCRANLDDIMVHPWVTKNGHYPLLPYKPLPPDPSVKQAVLDLVCKSGNVGVEEVFDSVEKDKCDWMSALYHILLDSSEARKIVQKKLKAEVKRAATKSSSKESIKQSLLEYSFALNDRESSDFVPYESESLEGGEQDPTPMVEESYLDSMDIRAGQNTLRLHRSPMGTFERRRSATHPQDPDEPDYTEGIHYSDAPATRPRIPRTMTHQYKDGEAVVPRVPTVRKNSAGSPPAYTLVHYDSPPPTGDPQMRRSTSLDMRSGYNPTYTWDRHKSKSSQPQSNYPAQATTNQPYYTSPRPNTNSDSYNRRPYEYIEETSPHQSYYQGANYGHGINTPLALSVDWAQQYQPSNNQTWGSVQSSSVKKGKRSTNSSYLEHLNDFVTPIPQQTLPQRKTKDRPSIMPVLNPDTNTLPGYKVSYTETPIEGRQVSNTLPNRNKKPNRMPGTRGYNKNKELQHSAGLPMRMLSNPDPNVSPFSANRAGNVYDHSFTNTGGYMWVSDQHLSKSKDGLEKSEKKKTFWKFRWNKSKENLEGSNLNTKTPPPEADPGVYATMSKKKLFQSSIHNLHKPADITSLQQESSSSNNAQRMETDLISKPNPTLTPMENSTPTTKTKGVTRKSALQQTPVTQVKPASTGVGIYSDKVNSTDTTQIKVQLQQAIEEMNTSYIHPEVHEGGYMSDSGLATPSPSSRDLERPTSSRIRSLLARPFKSGKKKP